MAEFTTAQKQEIAQWIIDNQTQNVADIETATDISASGATIPVVQGDGKLKKYDIGSALNTIDSASVAEAARVSAENARVAAEAERAANYADMKEACDGAAKVNATLANGTLTVTDRTGSTSEVNIGAAYETIDVSVSTSVSGVTVAGTVISLFLNNSSTAISYTLDDNGETEFTIARGTYYEIAFPDKANCKSIPSISGTATGSEDGTATSYSVVYEAYSEDEVETVTVNVRKRTDGAYAAWSGATVHVKIGTDTTDYTTDSNGQATFTVGYGQSYTVSMDEDTTGGYYIHNGVLSFSYTARVKTRVVWMTWYEYRTGVFVVCDDGVEYTADEWAAAGKTTSETPAIKVVTERLSEGGGAVYIDASRLNTAIGSATEYPVKQWATGAMQTTSIDSITNSTSSATYYDGASATDIIIAAGEDQGCEAPAASYCKEQTLVIGSTTKTGYLPAIGQWIEVWANRSAVDTWLSTLFGDDAKQLSNFTANKGTSTQSNADGALYFTSSPLNGGKNNGFRAVPFYA